VVEVDDDAWTLVEESVSTAPWPTSGLDGVPGPVVSFAQGLAVLSRKNLTLAVTRLRCRFERGSSRSSPDGSRRNAMHGAVAFGTLPSASEFLRWTPALPMLARAVSWRCCEMALVAVASGVCSARAPVDIALIAGFALAMLACSLRASVPRFPRLGGEYAWSAAFLVRRITNRRNVRRAP